MNSLGPAQPTPDGGTPASTSPDPAGRETPDNVGRVPTRGRRKRPRGSDPRSRDPERQAKFLLDMLAAFTGRAMDEDPGIGLAALMAIETAAHQAVARVGRHQVEMLGYRLVGEGLDRDPKWVWDKWVRPYRGEEECSL